MAIPKPTPTIPFTHDAFQKLQDDYHDYQKEKKEIMERLKTAREMGDLSENGAYKYAKFELGRVSRQLRELKHLLDNGYVTTKTTSDKVDFGSTVTVQLDSKEMSFLIVSQHESDLTQNKLSMDSPLGSALMGKSVGDTMTVNAPAGEMRYKIVAIK